MLHANPLGLPIGCQTWPVRSMIAKDFPGTLKQLAAAGFQSIEMCSPVGYADSGFGGLRKYSGSELRKIVEDAGLTCVSSHFSPDELRKDQEGRIAWAKEMGLNANAGGEPGRAEESDHGRCEASRRGIQPHRRARRGGGHRAGPA